MSGNDETNPETYRPGGSRHRPRRCLPVSRRSGNVYRGLRRRTAEPGC